MLVLFSDLSEFTRAQKNPFVFACFFSHHKDSVLVAADSSMTTEQDKAQGGQCNMQDSIRQHATVIMSRSAKPHELADLRQNHLQTGITVLIVIYDSPCSPRILNHELDGC
jgi:hypothetical protein